MLKNYNDHAANERTYLAWVRTSITFMTFALFIEKFELLLSNTQNSQEAGTLINLAGIAMFSLSLLILLLATWQYYRIKQHILASEKMSVSTHYINVILTVLVLLIGLMLFAAAFFD